MRRDKEVESASKKGRHRDADTQMKAFADKFEERLTLPLPPLSSEHATARPKMLGVDPTQAIAYQQAVRNAMNLFFIMNLICFEWAYQVCVDPPG